ncbi:serine/threonine-protein kinase [Nonomuraea longicatena]|uniref:non-specific serine/threonine protein kinase n=1 Tax=Nonomuraea longicatena TaxID=83682 RepID=A0ABP4BLN5_9ACTN
MTHGGTAPMLAGRYRLLSQLGQGGMGTVWRALDELLRQEVAVKEVRPPADLDHAAQTELVERTLREARAAARLRSHPSIVTIHDVVMDGGRPWIVMELVHGRSLDRVVSQDGPLPPQTAAWVGVHVLDALTAAHTAGVLHRDVKPGNVMLTDDNRVLLTDFGIAAVSGDAVLTQTGLLTGSPGYIAPERLRGEQDGPAADLWSLAATLYTAVEGRPAFPGHNAAARMAAVLLHPPSPPQLAGPLTPVLAAMLEKDPVRRCGAAQATDWLNAVARELSPDVPTTPRGRRRASDRSSRRPIILGAAALVTALAVAGGVTLWAVSGDPAPPAGAASKSSTGSGSRSGSGSRTGSDSGSGSGSPSGSATPASTANRMFTTDLIACDLLTAAKTRTLLRSRSVKRIASTKGVCSWQTPGYASTIQVSTLRFNSLDIARSTFDSIAYGMKDQPKRVPGTKIRTTRLFGDQMLSHVNKNFTGTYSVTALVHYGNLSVTVSTTTSTPGYRAADEILKIIDARVKTHR